ncbi:sensor domain-containing diguanylate cyclase [Aestuariibacter halophilus]|uniref:diguanylate cyclase n=1 Tax=Fluctibacter halophilus TaxID=226011 RepID=A0ABS8G9A9_9ALTE|nr:diguanylate cyclase [Aestuariibacter halophilus]MCC2617125.1 sensor domain-containing diguanylate cyclase [Aestuariibacter halophilus]
MLRSANIIIVLIVLLAGAVLFGAYQAISNVVGEQSRIQLQATSPVFSLVNEELLKPLHFAQAIGSAHYFHDLFATEAVDKDAVIERLQTLSKQFDLKIFAASEKARMQYFDDGNTLELVPGKVFWYFEAKQQPRDLFADLGRVGDVHLFFDTKIYSAEGEFLGIVGTAKSMREFVDKFDEYKNLYGYDFLFVNDNDQIVLSSMSDLVVTNENIPALSNLSWYARVGEQDDVIVNSLVSVNQEDYLLSEILIEELDWRVLLLIPLETRQAHLTQAFLTNTVGLMTLVGVLVLVTFFLVMRFKRNVEDQASIDVLTGLPTRVHIYRAFQRLKRKPGRLFVMMVDIDHFKKINDKHGHNVGDAALRHVADILKQEVRQLDTIGRWGGEEFVVLLPDVSRDHAMSVAERARQRIVDAPMPLEDGELSITASFGLAQGKTTRSLASLLADADTALYEAKRSGRNRVCSFE